MFVDIKAFSDPSPGGATPPPILEIPFPLENIFTRYLVDLYSVAAEFTV